MALRVRKDGRILCAAIHPEEPGDTYIPDDVHYYLTVERKLIVTEAMDRHQVHGQWWWRGSVPADKVIEPFYLDQKPEVV